MKKFVICLGIFLAVLIVSISAFVFLGEYFKEDVRTSVLLATAGENCVSVDLSSMPVKRVDKSGRTCYGRSDDSTTWNESYWTLEKGDGEFEVGCNYEKGAWRAYGIQSADVSGNSNVTLKADLSTTSSLIHYDDYVDLVVFSKDKTSSLAGCDSTPATDDNWGTKCALNDLTTDSLGHCGLPKYVSSASCNVDLDVSGLDEIYLVFRAADPWDAAFGVLKDSFKNVKICTSGAAVAETFDVRLTKTTYGSSDTKINFVFEFENPKEQTLTFDILNEDGEYVNSLGSSNVHLYANNESPYSFTLPIEWEEEGTYDVHVKVTDWTNGETTVYMDDSMSFYYEGKGAVCGDLKCDSGETCKADKCCSGVSVNFNTDVYNCGSCGNVCSLDYECQNGACVDVGDYDDWDDDSGNGADCGADCEEAKECALGLSSLEGCFVEVLDVIPLLDKPAAVSLLGDDLCSIKERCDLSDPIGMAITSALMAIDLADNAVDFTIVGYGVTVASDTVEGIIDCIEGILYQGLKMCGGYTSCLADFVKGVNAVTGGGMLISQAFSPVELNVVDQSGNRVLKSIVINKSDLKIAIVPNPDKVDFKVVARGTSEGTYDLGTTIYDKNGDLVKKDFQSNIPVSLGTIISYDIDVPSDYDAEDIKIKPTTQSGLNFTDMAGHWAYTFVESLVNSGVISGYADGTFKPDKFITRAEILRICLEAFRETNIQTIGESVTAKNNIFTDVYSSDWYYKYVTFAAYHNMVSGYPGGTFKPTKNVTRAEAVRIILMTTGLDLPLEAPSSGFKDVASSDWFSYFVDVAVSQDYLHGYDDNTFRPNQPMTRAEASTVVKLVRDSIL